MRLLRSELLKLTTVRTTWLLIGIGLAIEGLFAGLFTGLVPASELPALGEIQTGTGLLMAMMLVLGVLSATTEFRHGTASTTFLAVPRRYPVIGAKLVAVAAAGLLTGLAYVVLNGGITLPIFDSRTGALPATGDIASTYAGVVVSLALLCAFGLGVGAIIRNQVGAIIAALAFFFVLSTLPMLLPGEIGRYFPGQALGALQGLPEEGLSQLGGGLVLSAWSAALCGLGALLLVSRDLND